MRIYKVANVDIDASRGEIRRAGAVVHTEPKVLGLILQLVEADGEIVGHEAILERLWPGVRVSRDALYRVVKEARSVLGDDGRRQALIQTLPGQGIRWIAPIEVSEPTDRSISVQSLETLQESYESGRLAQTREDALRLAEALEGPASAVRRARALILASDLMLHGQVDRRWTGLAREILNSLPAEATLLRAALLARQAYQLYWSLDSERGAEALRSAREIAERENAADVLACIKIVDHMLCVGAEKAELRRSHAEAAVQYASRAGLPQVEQWAREQVAHDALESADVAAVEEQAGCIELLAEQYPLAWASRVRTLLHLHFGDLPAAERALLREAEDLECSGPHGFQYVGGPLLWLRYEQGRLDEIMPLLRQFVSRIGELPVWRAALARGEWEVGEHATARLEYEGVVAGGLRRLGGSFLSGVAEAHLGYLCAEFKDTARVAEFEEFLLPHQGRLIVSPRATFSLGPADLLLGRLAALAGRAEEARDRIEAALSLAARLRSQPWQARCMAALASPSVKGSAA